MWFWKFKTSTFSVVSDGSVYEFIDNLLKKVAKGAKIVDVLDDRIDLRFVGISYTGRIGKT